MENNNNIEQRIITKINIIIAYFLRNNMKEYLVKSNYDFLTELEKFKNYISDRKILLCDINDQQLKYFFNNCEDFYSFLIQFDNLNHEDYNLEKGSKRSDAKKIAENNMNHIKITLNNYVYSLKMAMNDIQNEVNRIQKKDQIHIFNDDYFYQEKIRELEIQKKEIEDTINNIENVKNQEIDNQRELLTQKENELKIAINQISEFEKELEEKKKQDNINILWKSKIINAFESLKLTLIPIRKEYSRLNNMYWIYVSLMTFIFVLIIFLEIIIFFKLTEVKGFPSWQNYIPAITPIPILGALLWAFIIQLNRTQRQLLMISRYIHEIEYVEGILISINTLSPDINISITRINNALDKILDNHLIQNSDQSIFKEKNIMEEEKKDTIPIDHLYKIIDSLKGIVSK